MAHSKRRKPQRRGALKPPSRRKSSGSKRAAADPAGLGFESLVHRTDAVPDSFSPGLAAEVNPLTLLESGGEQVNLPGIQGSPRDAVGASVFLHVAIAALLLFQSDFGGLMAPDQPNPERPTREEALVLPVEFLDAVPVQPVVPAPAPAPPAAAQPPQVADNGMVIPKASKPPPNSNSDFMNDLPFSEGNTDEFYTDNEVNDPGEPGNEDANDASESEESLAEDEAEPESVEEEAGSASEDDARTEVADERTELADGRLVEERLRRRLRDFGLSDPLRARPAPGAGAMSRRPANDGRVGNEGQGGTFEDIRRFLADKRFQNPDGGLVTGGPTLYYNDKGANFVPWLRRMINEVKRNWMIPYSVNFNAGHVAVGVVVSRDGTVVELKNIVPSGTAGFDNAAIGAVRAADLLPLPSDYPDDRFEIILVFWYNERPYDIFG